MLKHYFQCANVADFEICRECGIKNILITYPRVKTMLKKYRFESLTYGFESVFLDSGSYTARRLGKDVDFEQYAEFLDVYGEMVDVAAQLDEGYDFQKNLSNYEKHLQRGHNVLPVIWQSWDVNLSKMKHFIRSDIVLLRWDKSMYGDADDVELALLRLPTSYKYHVFWVWCEGFVHEWIGG